jgi:hypothetical protein
MSLRIKILGLGLLCLSLGFTAACMKPKDKKPQEESEASCPQPPSENIRVCKDGSKAIQEKAPSCYWACPEDQRLKPEESCATFQRMCKDGSAAIPDPEWGKTNCRQTCPED